MTRWNENEDAGGGSFMLGALAGALVGAGVALLMAPKTGAQMREELSSGYNSARDAAARRYRDLADRASARFDEGGSGYQQPSSRADNTADDFSRRPSSTMGDIPGGAPRL